MYQLHNISGIPQSPCVVLKDGRKTYVTIMPKSKVKVDGVLDNNWRAQNEGAIIQKQLTAPATQATATPVAPVIQGE